MLDGFMKNFNHARLTSHARVSRTLKISLVEFSFAGVCKLDDVGIGMSYKRDRTWLEMLDEF